MSGLSSPHEEQRVSNCLPHPQICDCNVTIHDTASASRCFEPSSGTQYTESQHAAHAVPQTKPGRHTIHPPAQIRIAQHPRLSVRKPSCAHRIQIGPRRPRIETMHAGVSCPIQNHSWHPPRRHIYTLRCVSPLISCTNPRGSYRTPRTSRRPGWRGRHYWWCRYIRRARACAGLPSSPGPCILNQERRTRVAWTCAGWCCACRVGRDLYARAERAPRWGGLGLTVEGETASASGCSWRAAGSTPADEPSSNDDRAPSALLNSHNRLAFGDVSPDMQRTHDLTNSNSKPSLHVLDFRRISRLFRFRRGSGRTHRSCTGAVSWGGPWRRGSDAISWAVRRRRAASGAEWRPAAAGSSCEGSMVCSSWERWLGFRLHGGIGEG